MVARAIAGLLSFMLLVAASPRPDHASQIASLIERAKLATFGQRAANGTLPVKF